MSNEIKEYWLSEEFQNKYEIAIEGVLNYVQEIGRKYEKKYNTKCIRFTESRIKTVESIEAKLERKELEKNRENLDKRINDIAGIRVICFNTAQVYKIVEMISSDARYKIIKNKDYINNPKKNGYQSYHLVLEVPVKVSSKNFVLKVEVQVRTILMDAWASVDAIVRYKSKKNTPKGIEKKIQEFTETLKEEDKIIQKIMEAE